MRDHYAIEVRRSGETDWQVHREYDDLDADLIAEFDTQLDLWNHRDDFRIVQVKRKVLDPHEARRKARRGEGR